MRGPKASLDLTHVVYDDSSFVSLALAWVTLSPILLMASYAALAVQTREATIIIMWAGQFACEGFNWVLKHVIKQERPDHSPLDGFGFPSSHSQYMGYFASFLMCHLYHRHRFASTGYPFVDLIWVRAVYLGLASWVAVVAYSRYALDYHSVAQVLWGIAIGVACGIAYYTCAEFIPMQKPHSVLGRFRAYLIANPFSQWLRIRDGWAVWSDAGREHEWEQWKSRWDTLQILQNKKD